MDRITIGAALGGAAVYFLDPQRGEDRRRRVQSFWRENRDTAFEVGGGVSQAAESMRPLVRRVKRGFGRGDWTEGGGPNWVPGVTWHHHRRRAWWCPHVFPRPREWAGSAAACPICKTAGQASGERGI